MTAQELLQKIVDGEAGEYVRYAPVDLLKAAQLLHDIETAPQRAETASSFFAALEAAAGGFTSDSE